MTEGEIFGNSSRQNQYINKKKIMKKIKLHPEVIGLLLKDFHYELSKESLIGDWKLDEDFYHPEKKCFKLHNENRDWLELPNSMFLKSIEFTYNVAKE